jgi:hypothetical protein
LQILNGIEQCIKMRRATAAGRKQALPMGEETGKRVLLDGLDFAAELGERLAANLAQDFRIAPLAMKSAGAEAAFENERSAFSTTAGSRANLSAGSRNVNGPWVRA